MEQGNIEIVKKSIKFGVVCAWTLLLVVILQLVVGFLFSYESLIMSVTIMAGVGALGYLYYEFLKGFVPISQQSKDGTFEKNVRLFMNVVVLSCFALVLIEVVKIVYELDSTDLLMLISSSVVYFVLGIVSIKIGNSFSSNQQELGINAEKAALYHKIAGWLLVTVLLGFIGIFVSLVADYYMWRVQQSIVKRQIPRPQ